MSRKKRLPSPNLSIALALFISILHGKDSLAQKKEQQLLLQDNQLTYVSKNGKETVVSKEAKAGAAIMYDGKILFIEEKAADGGKTSILSWDSRKQVSKPLVSQEMEISQDEHINDKIVNFLIDNRSNRLFFSTYSAQSKEYLTWVYDFMTGATKVFKDGLVKQTDDIGNVTVEIHSSDYLGVYTQQAVFAANGTLLRMDEKKY